MKRLKENLISIFLWTSGLCVFLPSVFVTILLTFLINPKKFDPFIKAWCRLLIRALFIKIDVKGLDHIKKENTYLFLSNHVNLFDGFVLYGMIPNFVRGVELDEHFNWPIYGPLIRRLGMIPISRTNARNAVKSLHNAKSKIDNGTSVLILPEGGRTLDGDIKPFKRGSFTLAQKAEVDIVPIIMTGAYNINRKGSLLIKPGKMTLQFGAPVSWHTIQHLSSKEITQLFYEKMTDMFQG